MRSPLGSLSTSLITRPTRHFLIATGSKVQSCSLCATTSRWTPSQSKPSTASLLHNVQERSKRETLVFHSTSNNPYENLSIEHYLLTHSDPLSRILLFYTNRPCVVIGRNQNPWVECNLGLLRNVDLVRRRSGGGTVFHDEGNLNFSIIVPNDNDFTRRKHAEMVVRALKSTEELAEHKLFDDVWVNDRHDITMLRTQGGGKEYKVSGSAFKLTRGRALHHGTLLHSSPNLNNISQFLRSPGREYIQAKGVESVRSPVSNLFNITPHERNTVRSTITKAIVTEFAELYGRVTEEFVENDHPEVEKGVQELMTDDWKFGQTPRFEFEGKMENDKRITMSVNHGVIEKASFGVQVPRIHEIADWRSVARDVPIGLVEQLERVFPALLSQDGNVDRGTIMEHGNEITRRMKDGTVEFERRGRNTVEQK